MNAKQILCMVSISAACLFMPACSEPKSAPDEATDESPVKKEPASSVAKTSGVLLLDGVPKEDVTLIEVIIVSKLDPETQERLNRQRQLFEYKLTGINPEQRLASVYGSDISFEDTTMLLAAMEKLKAQFVDQITVDTKLNEAGVDDDRTRKIPSDHIIYEKYKKLFKAITLENMERALPFINDSIRVDSERLAVEINSDDAYAAKQAEITLRWLKAVNDQLKQYLKLANAQIDARGRLAKKGALWQANTWEAFVGMIGDQLTRDVYKYSVGSAIVDSDGTFESEGQGQLIIRIIYGSLSVFFIPDAPSETRVQVTELKTSQ